MEKINFDGQLRRQCFSLPSLCKEQIDGLRKGMEQTIPMDVIRGIRRVILTGCGDSYLAARAAVPAFKKYAGAFASRFEAIRCIDVARKIELEPKNAASTLIIAISASGSPARIEEVLRRGRHHGCKTLLVTNFPESRGAKAAEYTLIVNTPPFNEYGPGLRNYYASISGLFTLAAYMGEAKGFQPDGTIDRLYNAISEYTYAFASALEEIDNIAFRTALAWKDVAAVEAVGDYTDFASAYFIAAKIVEVAGVITTTVDSENWCHVNYFAHSPEKIGTVIVSTKDFANFSRIKETLMTVEKIGRPALLITTGTGEDYAAGPSVAVCTLPKAPEGFAFIEPLLNHVPGSILASYMSAMHGEPYFRAADSINKTSPYGHSLQTSKIEII